MYEVAEENGLAAMTRKVSIDFRKLTRTNSEPPSVTQRLARVVEQKVRGPGTLSLGEICDAILERSGVTAKASGYEKELARMTEKQFLNHLLQLALNSDAQQQVNAEALGKIAELETKWKTRPAADTAQNAYLLFQIDRFRNHPKEFFPKPSQIPNGPPIGAED